MKPHRLFFFFHFALTVWWWKAGSSQEGAETSKLLWRAQPPGQPEEKAVRWSSDRAPHFAAKCHVVFWAPVRQSARTLMTQVAESKKKKKKKQRSVTRVLDRGIYRKGWVCSRAASTCVGERKKGAACVWSHIWSGWRCWLQSLFWWLAAWTCKFKTGDFTWLNTHWLEWLVFANFMYLPICFTSGCYISWFKCDVILYYI